MVSAASGQVPLFRSNERNGACRPAQRRQLFEFFHTPTTIDIVVEDDGPGIPENATEQVFAPFFRLEQSRSRETGGVGLGLSIARAIVRHHGGDIVLSQNRPAQKWPGLRASVSLPKVMSG
ncbi:signal transduction histidine kinase [Rhizobium mongolense]|uniref:histidine kinase n=1 Tax=Rhizobium mongolense TaxID=57676 RepID=A0ABR6IHA2_9HYPH|nr:signal transduction histidine kinase [Rhizobium mongolense]